jgi:tRNA G18 (ribose-2'-O)-methylase SpoU
VPVAVPDDERLAGYAGLRDGHRRDRVERHLGVFVAEGLLALQQLVASPFPVVSVLVAEDRWERVRPVLEGVEGPCYVAAPAVLAAITGFDVHRGVLALGRRLPDEDPDALLARLAPTAPVLVTEGVNDHENLGALFRSAAALGAGAVLGDPSTCDPLYRRSIRVSLGHALRVPWTRLTPWPARLDALRRSGRSILALTPDPAARPIGEVTGVGPAALLVGAEGPGLTAAALAAADVRVRIPLAAGVDSLNVATAAAIALHRLSPGLA